ncbi:MAG: hypothetical protein BGO45_14645 [Microbacterium sp. 71-36]|nr:hypothetical protein [Microbacterium sp.]ODT39907.1 MAG: hypothetical protein ABS60_05450 [Microbacterium sp. SCN 71-17]OJV78416.1 MAG: hypothetical protein BGO45_14645 [Microbacterium sp. 71-36]
MRPEQPPRPARRGWDLVITVVLLVLLPLAALAGSYAGFFLAFASDACGSVTCDYGVMNVGLWFAVVAPWVVLLLTVVVAIIRLVRHRVAFWVPLAGIVLMGAMWFVAAAIVSAGVSAS